MKQIIKNIIKISTFSLIFILSFYIFNTFANNSKSNEIKTTPNNNANYKNIIIKPISNVAVAIATNIGLGLNKKGQISIENINNKVYSINDFYNNYEKIKKGLIQNNLLFIKEYHNFLKTDFSLILKKSNNKKQTLNNIIKQLKIRLEKANENLQNLYKQKTILLNEYEKINTQIENLKRKLEKDFNKYDTQEVFKNIDKYYELKNKQIIIKTNIVFINNFIKRYLLLNKYASELLNVLTLNQDIISKNSYIVIPKSGTKLLKEFELLFTEEEYMNKIKNKKIKD